MKKPALQNSELGMICSILVCHHEVTRGILYGSRAKGSHTERSDIDLALEGDLDPLAAEAIAEELDELPMPYRVDVQSLPEIKNPALRDHIERVAIVIYTREARQLPIPESSSAH